MERDQVEEESQTAKDDRRDGRCFKRLMSAASLSGSQPTCHLCVMGVAERDDEALREVSLSFGEVSSIERNAKVIVN